MCIPILIRSAYGNPDLQEHRFVPVSNNVLAKAEIPFLIFERNRGKCFIEAH